MFIVDKLSNTCKFWFTQCYTNVTTHSFIKSFCYFCNISNNCNYIFIAIYKNHEFLCTSKLDYLQKLEIDIKLWSNINFSWLDIKNWNNHLHFFARFELHIWFYSTNCDKTKCYKVPKRKLDVSAFDLW